MRGKKEAQEQLIRKFQKSGSANNIEAHFLEMIVSSINEEVSKSSSQTKLSSLLNPQIKKTSKSDEISKEIVINFLKQHNLNYTLSSLFNESSNTIKIEHNKQWINKALQFSKKDSPVKQLLVNHEKNQTSSAISKKPKDKINTKSRSEEDTHSINSFSSSTLNSIPAGYTRQEWDKKQMSTMNRSLMAEPSSVNLSDFIPDGESTTMWEEGVNRAVNQLSTSKNFDNQLPSSSSKSHDKKKTKDTNATNRNLAISNETLSEISSSLSQIVPQGESLKGWNNGVQNAVNRLIEPIDFSSSAKGKASTPLQSDSVNSLLSESDGKNIKTPKNNENSHSIANSSELSEDDSLTSRFSETQKQNEKKEKVLRFFREESDDIRIIHDSSSFENKDNKATEKGTTFLSESDSSEKSISSSGKNKRKKKNANLSDSNKENNLSSGQDLSQLSIQGASSGHIKRASRRKVSKIKRTNDDIFDGISSQVSSTISINEELSDNSKKNKRNKNTKNKRSKEILNSDASSNQPRLSDVSLADESTDHIKKEALRKVRNVELSNESGDNFNHSGSSASPEYHLSQVPLKNESSDHRRKEALKKVRNLELSDESPAYSKRSQSSTSNEYRLSQIPLNNESSDHMRKEALKKVRNIELYDETSPSSNNADQHDKKQKNESILSSSSTQDQNYSLSEIDSDQEENERGLSAIDETPSPLSSSTNKRTPSPLSSSTNKNTPHSSSSKGDNEIDDKAEKLSDHSQSSKEGENIEVDDKQSNHSYSIDQSTPIKTSEASDTSSIRTKEAPLLDEELYRSRRDEILSKQQNSVIKTVDQLLPEITTESLEVDVEIEEEEEEKEENSGEAFAAPIISKHFVVEEESEFSYANSSESVNKSQSEVEENHSDIHISVSLTDDSTSTDSHNQNENYDGIKNVIRYSTVSSEECREKDEPHSLFERNVRNSYNEGQNQNQINPKEYQSNNSDDYFVIIASTPSHSEESYSSHSLDANSFRQAIAITNATEIPYHSSLSNKESYQYDEEEEEEEEEEENAEEEDSVSSSRASKESSKISNEPSSMIQKKKKKQKMVRLRIKDNQPQNVSNTNSRLKTAETQAERIPVIKNVVLKSESSSYEIEPEKSKSFRKSYIEKEYEYEYEEEIEERNKRYSLDEEDSLFTQELEKVDISAWIQNKPTNSSYQRFIKHDDSDTYAGSTIDEEYSPSKKVVSKGKHSKNGQKKISPASPKKQITQKQNEYNKSNQSNSIQEDQSSRLNRNSQLNTIDNTIDDEVPQSSEFNQSSTVHQIQNKQSNRQSQLNTIDNTVDEEQTNEFNRNSQLNTIDNVMNEEEEEVQTGDETEQPNKESSIHMKSSSQIEKEPSQIKNTVSAIEPELEETAPLNRSQFEPEDKSSKKKKSKSKKKEKPEEELNEIHQSFLEKSELQQPLTLMETEKESEHQSESYSESESESEDEIEKKLKHKETDERKLSLKLPSPVEEASSFYPNKFSHFNLSDPFNRNIPKMPKTMATPASPDTLDSSIMPQDKIDSDEEEQIFEEEEQNYSDLGLDFSEIYDYQYRKDMKNNENENQNLKLNQPARNDTISMISTGDSNFESKIEKANNNNNKPSHLANKHNREEVMNIIEEEEEESESFNHSYKQRAISRVDSLSDIISNYKNSPKYNPQLNKQEEKTANNPPNQNQKVKLQKRSITSNQNSQIQSNPNKKSKINIDDSNSDVKPSFYAIFEKQNKKNSGSSIIEEDSYNSSSQPGGNENNGDQFDDNQSLFSEIYERSANAKTNVKEENLSSASSTMLSDNLEGNKGKSNRKKVRKVKKLLNSKSSEVSQSSSSEKIAQSPSLNTVPVSESPSEFSKVKQTPVKTNNTNEQSENQNNNNSSLSDNEKVQPIENQQVSTKNVQIIENQPEENEISNNTENFTDKIKSSPGLFSSNYEGDQTRKFHLSSLQGGPPLSSSSSKEKVEIQQAVSNSSESSNISEFTEIYDRNKGKPNDSQNGQPQLRRRKKKVIKNSSSSSSISNTEPSNINQNKQQTNSIISNSSSANSVFSDAFERSQRKNSAKNENQNSQVHSDLNKSNEIQQKSAEISDNSLTNMPSNAESSSSSSRIRRRKKVVKTSSKQNSIVKNENDISNEKLSSEQFKFTPKTTNNDVSNEYNNIDQIKQKSKKASNQNHDTPSEFSEIFNERSSGSNSSLANKFIKKRSANQTDSFISEISSNSSASKNSEIQPQKVIKTKKVKRVKRSSQIDNISSSSSDSSIKPKQINSHQNDKIEKIESIDFTGIHHASSSENGNEEDIQFDIPSPHKNDEKENLNFSADMSLNSGSINDSLVSNDNETANKSNNLNQIKNVKKERIENKIKNAKGDNLNSFKTTSVKAVDLSDNQNSQSAVGGLIELNTDSEY